MLEEWNSGNNGTMEQWKDGMMEYWNVGETLLQVTSFALTPCDLRLTIHARNGGKYV